MMDGSGTLKIDEFCDGIWEVRVACASLPCCGSGKKKEHKINSLGPEIAGWGGGRPRQGVGVEKVVPSLESLFSLGFAGGNLGCHGNLARMSRTPRTGVLKKFVQQKICSFSRPSHLVSQDCSRASTRKISPKRGPRKSHEKATKKPRKSNEKGPNTVFLDRRGPRKSHEKTTKKPRKSNE